MDLSDRIKLYEGRFQQNVIFTKVKSGGVTSNNLS